MSSRGSASVKEKVSPTKYIGRHWRAVMAQGGIHELALAGCKMEGHHRHALLPSRGADWCKVGGRHRRARFTLRKKSPSVTPVALLLSLLPVLLLFVFFDLVFALPMGGMQLALYNLGCLQPPAVHRKEAAMGWGVDF